MIYGAASITVLIDQSQCNVNDRQGDDLGTGSAGVCEQEDEKSSSASRRAELTDHGAGSTAKHYQNASSPEIDMVRTDEQPDDPPKIKNRDHRSEGLT